MRSSSSLPMHYPEKVTQKLTHKCYSKLLTNVTQKLTHKRYSKIDPQMLLKN